MEIPVSVAGGTVIIVLAVGLAAGRLILSGSDAAAPAAARSDGPARDRAPEPAAKPRQAKELEEARLEAVRAREALERARQDNAALKREMAALESRAAELAAPRAPDPAAPALPAERGSPAARGPEGETAQRVRSLEASVAEAIEARDGRKLLAILKELGPLGEAAFPLARTIVNAACRFPGGLGTPEAFRRPNELGVMAADFLAIANDPAFAKLDAEALGNPAAFGADFRRLAAGALANRVLNGAMGKETFLGQLASETDEQVGRALAQAVSNQMSPDTDPKVTDSLLKAFKDQSTPGVRAALVNALATRSGEGVDKALVEAAVDPDAGVRRAAMVALAGRKPQTVTGFFVLEPAPGSRLAGAGLAGGDIVTQVGGKPIDSIFSLAASVRGGPGRGDASGASGGKVPVLLSRDGQTVALEVPGQVLGEASITGGRMVFAGR